MEVKYYLKPFSNITIAVHVSFATMGGAQKCVCMAQYCFFCPIFRLYFDILHPVLLCLYIFPVGSIKNQHQNPYIYLLLTTLSCALHSNRLIFVAKSQTFKVLNTRLLKAAQNLISKSSCLTPIFH